MFQITTHTKDNFTLTSDPKKIDKEVVYELLLNSYWAHRRNKQIIDKSIENSLCFSVYDKTTQVGFVRIVTDSATFAYLCDIIIEPSYRGTGLGQWVMEHVLNHPNIKDLGRTLLVTKDAHTFYEKFGFDTLESPEKFMELRK